MTGANVFLVGAPKSGTTSLFSWLSRSPEVGTPDVKEPMYYCGIEEPFAGPDAAYLNDMVVRERAAYEALFRGVSGRPVRLDASTDYLSWPGTAARIAADVPDARIIAVLRQPAERAWSEHLHLVRDGLETLSFPEALEAEAERTEARWNTLYRHVYRSLYADGLADYLETFGRERVLVLLHETLARDAREVQARIADFLGIAPRFDPLPRENVSGRPRIRLVERLARGQILPRWMKRTAVALLGHRVRRAAARVRKANMARPPLDPELRRELTRAHFAEDIGRTEELLGVDLDHWRSPGREGGR